MSNMRNMCSDLIQFFFFFFFEREREREREGRMKTLFDMVLRGNLRTSTELEITIILEFSSEKGMIKTDKYC